MVATQPPASAPKAEAPKVERKSKGRSIVINPKHYTVVDTETTGLDSQKSRIIEIAAIRVRGGKEVARFETLIKPGRKLGKKIVELTGITDDDLKDAPSQEEALQQFMDFLKDDIIVAHNANFDVDFLYDSMVRCDLKPLMNNFIDTLRLAKYITADVKNYKLETLAQKYQISQPTAHRAMADCETTKSLLEKLMEDAECQAIDLRDYQTKGYTSRFKVAGIVSEAGMENPSSPFYGKQCAFTGELDSMTRLEAAQTIANIGGRCVDKVSKNTNYLIQGEDTFYFDDPEKKTANLKKAEELISAGADLQILSESVFLDMLQE